MFYCMCVRQRGDVARSASEVNKAMRAGTFFQNFAHVRLAFLFVVQFLYMSENVDVRYHWLQPSSWGDFCRVVVLHPFDWSIM